MAVTRRQKRKAELMMNSSPKRVHDESPAYSSSMVGVTTQGQEGKSYRQLLVYTIHVQETEGFDVSHFPGVAEIDLIRLSDEILEHNEKLKMFVRMAIEHFKTNVDQDAKLEGAKVLNATLQLCGTTVKHHITFEATDADRDQVKTYQAVVWRPKPTAAPTEALDALGLD